MKPSSPTISMPVLTTWPTINIYVITITDHPTVIKLPTCYLPNLSMEWLITVMINGMVNQPWLFRLLTIYYWPFMNNYPRHDAWLAPVSGGATFLHHARSHGWKVDQRLRRGEARWCAARVTRSLRRLSGEGWTIFGLLILKNHESWWIIIYLYFVVDDLIFGRT